MDVIEHVPDDVAFLGDICGRSLVGDGTWFLMTVPSFQSLFSSHDRFLGHYRRYTVRSFRQVFRASQLQSAEEGYFFSTLLPVRVLQLLKERVVGSPETFVGLSGWHGSESTSQLARVAADARRPHLDLARARRTQTSRSFEFRVMQEVCVVVPCFNEEHRLRGADFLSFITSHPNRQPVLR